jgi:hypothetical protein
VGITESASIAKGSSNYELASTTPPADPQHPKDFFKDFFFFFFSLFSTDGTRGIKKNKIFLGKVHISPSNYHPIDNVSLKLSIVTMSPLNYQNIANVHPKASKKIKRPLYISQQDKNTPIN